MTPMVIAMTGNKVFTSLKRAIGGKKMYNDKKRLI